MAPFRENLRGIVAMVAANLALLLNDTQVKLAGDDLPIGEILFLRGLFSCLFIFGLVLYFGQLPMIRMLFTRRIAWRTLGEIGATLLFITALLHMPIANIMAILQVVPLMTTAASALFFGEQVGWRRWTAIAIGFIGVVIVLRPGGEGFNIFSLVALGAMCFISFRDMVTRTLTPGTPSLLVAGLASVAVAFTGVAIAPSEEWVWPSAGIFALFVGAGIFVAIGQSLMIFAMRTGDIGVTAPFRYSVIIWAIVVGYLIWGDVPDAAMLIGSAIIIASGVYTFHRERVRARLARIGQ